MNLGEDMSKGRDSRRAMLDERKRDKPGPASQENQRPCILESSIWTTTAVHMNAWMLDTIFKYAWSHVYTLRFPRTRKLCGGFIPPQHWDPFASHQLYYARNSCCTILHAF